MTKKNALGRGLGALIDGVEKEVLEKKVEANLDISVDSIDANPFQPRTSFDEQSLEELATSIKKLGIVQPLTVRETGDGQISAYCRGKKTQSCTSGRTYTCTCLYQNSRRSGNARTGTC